MNSFVKAEEFGKLKEEDFTISRNQIIAKVYDSYSDLNK